MQLLSMDFKFDHVTSLFIKEQHRIVSKCKTHEQCVQKSLVVLISYADLWCPCCHCRRWHMHKLPRQYRRNEGSCIQDINAN